MGCCGRVRGGSGHQDDGGRAVDGCQTPPAVSEHTRKTRRKKLQPPAFWVTRPVTTTTMCDVIHNDITHTYTYYTNTRTHYTNRRRRTVAIANCSERSRQRGVVVWSAAALAYVHAHGDDRGAHTPRNAHATTISRAVSPTYRRTSTTGRSYKRAPRTSADHSVTRTYAAAVVRFHARAF